jgi:hypothetical protein
MSDPMPTPSGLAHVAGLPGVITSPETDKLDAAFVKAQSKFKPVVCDSKATVRTKTGETYSYTYASLNAILDATRPALNEAGISFMQLSVWNPVDGMFQLWTRIAHAGQFLMFPYPMHTYDRAQEQGSEITYARRYSAAPLFGIASEEDEDGKLATEATPTPGPRPVPTKAKPPAAAAATSSQPSERAESKPGHGITEPQQKRLFAIAKSSGWSNDQIKDALKRRWGVEHSSEITWSRYDAVVEFFRLRPEEVGGPPEPEPEPAPVAGPDDDIPF